MEVFKSQSYLNGCSMPEMNGYEATQAIRSFEDKTGQLRTPIIAATAHALKQDKDRCLEADIRSLQN